MNWTNVRLSGRYQQFSYSGKITPCLNRTEQKRKTRFRVYAVLLDYLKEIKVCFGP